MHEAQANNLRKKTNKANRGLWKKLNWKTAINTEINRKKLFTEEKTDKQKKAKTGPRGNAVKFLLNNASPQEGTRKDKQSITKK